MTSPTKVVFAHETDEDGNFPRCKTDYAECPCPGPSQDDLYEYEVDANGTLWAYAKGHPECRDADHFACRRCGRRVCVAMYSAHQASRYRHRGLCLIGGCA